MKRLSLLVLLVCLGFGAPPARAQGLLGGLLSGVTTTLSNTVTAVTSTVTGLLAPPQTVIVRTNLGLRGLQNACRSNGCTVVRNLDGNQGQVFLVQPQQGLIPDVLASVLRLVNGIVDAEPDQLVIIPPNSSAGAYQTTVPTYLDDQTPVNYFGTTVWDGYVNQPAAWMIGAAQAQSTFNVTGNGAIVADIDTGVDPTHPALKPFLLQGYNFITNQPGASELNDLNGATGSACNSCQAAFVDQHTAAMLDQHTAAMLDGTQFADFGHGTEVLGMVHLVAPTARLLPLKAFSADGSGDLSNILSAIYYAVQNHANVINMSFELSSSSTELTDAINYANSNSVICVASSGNDGENEMVYPAGLSGVMGVASTNYFDQRSTFSNYGNQIVWVAAPGENIVTTYPFGTYSVTSGTSFTSPMVAGTAALLLNLNPKLSPSAVAKAISNAQWIGPNMGYGELNVDWALSAQQYWGW
ncbi:MAG: S8 family serine peptidase [Candidatus Acidiferrales bacterium]